MPRTRGEPVVLGLQLGHGWYSGRLAWTGERGVYGDRPAAIAQLEITYADGHRQVVGTDASWTAGPSPVLADDLYDGQTIDARLISDAWLQPGFTDPAWSPAVEIADADLSVLTPYVGPPVIRHEEIAPVAVWTSPSGKTLIDFGQNLVGWLKITSTGEAGSTITVRHAEVIEHDELGTRPLRSAQATDTFIRSGGLDVFEPTLTFHGFRYAEVTGLDEPISAAERGGRGRALRPAADRHLRLLRRPRQPAAQQRGVEPAGQLPRPARPTARSATSGRAGPVTSPSSPRRRPTCSTCRASCGDWLLDLAAEQRAANDIVPLVVPDVLKLLDNATGWPSDTPTAIWSDAGGLGALGAVGGVRRPGGPRAVPPVDGRARPGLRPPGVRRTGCGTRASSSVTGSTRPHRRRTRSWPRPTST